MVKYKENNKEEIIIYDKMIDERLRLEKQIDELKKRVERLPEGKLLCARNGNRYKWYQSDGHNKIYIPKGKRKIAEQLAEKKYLTTLLEDLMHEKNAIDYYLRHHCSETGKAEKMLTEESEYQHLLSPFFKTKSEELEEWSHGEYVSNPNHPEQLRYQGTSGRFLRSKSEVMIDIQLSANRIPFRYECALQLGEATIYPDFTIRHPKTGEVYYWEHFGMVDDGSYIRKTCLKLQQYMENGIIPSVQLITTYETKERPLGYEQIKKIIEEKFL